MLKNLFKTKSIIEINSRSFGQHNKKHIYKGEGIKYEGIRYYPRDPDHVDPPIEPSKLFRVQRIKPIKGNPFWEKRILNDLGIGERKCTVTIVKNIPENNARLWKIKHLIKITPITFPYGEPTRNDINYTFLKETGECYVAKEIEIDCKRIEASESFNNDKKRLDTDLLKKDSHMKWLNPW